MTHPAEIISIDGSTQPPPTLVASVQMCAVSMGGDNAKVRIAFFEFGGKTSV